MELRYKPDFEESRQRWRAHWEGQIIDRPCTSIVVPKNPRRAVSPPPYLYEVTHGVDAALDRYEQHFESHLFLGDAIPAVTLSAGPDMFAGFLGAEIESAAESERTSWAKPCIERWDDALPLGLIAESPTWRFMQDAVARTASRGGGSYLIAMLDLHTGMDALSAMRGPQRLCLDLHDDPRAVHQALDDARRAFFPVFEGIYWPGDMATWGCIRGPYCEGKYNIVACDFAYMLSPEMFREFVLPAIEDEAAFLDHAMFHVDGPGVLNHLDDIMAIDGIDMIQWVPGHHDPPLAESVESRTGAVV